MVKRIILIREENGIIGKDCTKCKLFLESVKFRPNPKMSCGLDSWCKTCWQSVRRKYNGTIDAAKRREYQYKHAYGITKTDLDTLLEKQENACAICKTKFPGNPRFKVFCVDHNHTTGKVRGLLCRNCNSGLGLFEDSPELIEKAIKYLEKYGHKNNISN